MASAPAPLIFLGPSLPRSEAEALCRGDYRPPIARGDLPRLAGDVPRTIVIVDGAFQQVRAVSPKEIVDALDRGHDVIGAASIGALRAVELEPFGMRGLGRIFEDFRSGALDADDEVALVFDPQTLQPLSEPLVNVRVALAEAVAAGIVAQEEAAALLDAARVLPYPHRTYPRIADGRDALLRFLTEFATDQKAEDARTALRLAARRGVAIPADDRDLPVRPGPPRPGPPLCRLERGRKLGSWDSVRTVPVEETERRLGRVRALAGITRVGDVTGMDRLGVPSYIAVRPSRDRECNSVYSGKALRAADARVGAQMEALEMACSLDDRVPLVTARYCDLGVRAVHPDRLIPLFDAPADLTAEPLEWVTGWDIVNGEAVLVPADAVFFRRQQRRVYWKISSNGLASGNTRLEAIAHGLAEVIERDAETMFRLATEYRHLPGMLRAVAGPAHVHPPDCALPPPEDFPLIRASTLPAPLARVVANVRAAGVHVALRRITSDVDIPTVLCALWEQTHDPRRHLMQYGCGTHPDPRVAARRAITEAAQSRVTAIQGAREDLEAGAVAESDPPPEWFDPAAGIDFAELGGFENRDLLADVELMVERLLEAGLDEVVAVDLTNPALEFPVVKMIVPGLELAFHAVDPARVPFGWRARRVFEPSWAEEVIAAAH